MGSEEILTNHPMGIIYYKIQGKNMNKDHYELKSKLNARAKARRHRLVENENMEELERYAMPLIWAFLIALVLFIGYLWIDASVGNF